MFPKSKLNPMAIAFLMFLLPLALVAVVKAPDTTPPEVLSTYPVNRQTGVSLGAPIFVNFTEQMIQLGVTVNVEPILPLLSPVWNMLGTGFVIDHPSPFLASTKYNVTVNGQDMAGNWLDGNHDGTGGDPYTWMFWTDCGGPCIVETIPMDGETNVPLDQPIIVLFGERVDEVALTVTIVPTIALTPNWMQPGILLTLTPVPAFEPCTIYTVTISAPGLLPGPAANPWHFETTGCAPKVIRITPPQVNASVDAPIVVDFSTSMNNATVAWTLNHTITLVASWNSGNTTLTLKHAERFLPCTAHRLSVSGKDIFGQDLVAGPVPNPYDFTTVCTYPRVLQMSPYHRQDNVPLDAPIIVTFSESMNNMSVADSFSYSDGVTFFTKSDGVSSWNQNNTVFTFSPDAPYRLLTTYTVRLNSSIARSIVDRYLDGNGNGIPEMYPTDDVVWQFTTAQVSDTTIPHVVSVYPLNGAIDVPLDVTVEIVFSEAMNRLSVQTAIMISDGRSPHDLSWESNSTLTFDVRPLMFYGTGYTIVVKNTASDLVGNRMQDDYSWSFTTRLWRGDIHGRVVDDADGTPIDNATVVLDGVQTVTDADGNFSLMDVLQGMYALNVSKSGYEQNNSLVTVAYGLQDLGTIKLRRVSSVAQSETPWAAVVFLFIAIVLVLLLLVLIAFRRRKVQPTKFEEWKGEVAEVETGEEDQ